ncbi:MAG: hypothetical protein KKH33_07020 [Alphaproteobacteria bacterium]|nr:hypothetical protein [Alphaproteobacteria bacterium]
MQFQPRNVFKWGLMRSWTFTAFLLTLAISGPGQAVSTCKGVVTETYMEPNGDAYVAWGPGWRTRICNANSTVAVDRGPAGGGTTNVTPATCQMLMSMFVTAKAQSKQVDVHVDKTSCSFSGGLENPYPFYFYFVP